MSRSIQTVNDFRNLHNSDFRKRFLEKLGYPKRPQFFTLADFSKTIVDSTQPGSYVLDIGAGECNWKILFSDCFYVGIDNCVGDKNWNYSHLDYIADAHSLPMRDNSFDLALCIAVLGHVPDPQRVIGEAFRVLKAGGIFFAMSEFAKAEHQAPYDFTRLTRYALLDYASKAGFVNIEIKGSNSFGTSILNLIESYAWKVSANGLSEVFRLLIRMLIRIRMFDLFYSLVKDKTGPDIFPTYFLLKCQKPVQSLVP